MTTLSKFSEDLQLEGTIKKVTSKLTAQIKAAAASDSTTWLNDLVLYTDALSRVEQVSIMAHASILSEVKALWKEEKIKIEIREAWDNDFYKFAARISKRRVKEPDKKTIQAWISVYEFYIKNLNEFGGFALPNTIYINSEKLDEEGEPIQVEIQPNLDNAEFSKLLIAKGLAEAQGGSLDDSLIYKLVTPDVTCGDVKLAVNHRKTILRQRIKTEQKDKRYKDVDWDEEPTEPKDYAEGFFFKNGIIYFTHDGTTVPRWIRNTKDVDLTDVVVVRADSQLFGRLGIPFDEEEFGPIEDDSYLNIPYLTETDDGHILLTLRGRKFHEFLPDDMPILEELFTQLKKILED